MSDLRIRADALRAERGYAIVQENGKDAYGRHAFTAGDRLCYRFLLPRSLGVFSASFSLCPDGEEAVLSLPLSYASKDGRMDVYTVTVDTKGEELPVGLYFCQLKLESAFGTLFAYGGNEMSFSEASMGERSVFQLTLSRFAHEAPSWVYGGVIYHVFVDRFFRGGDAPPATGTFINPDWENGTVQYPAYPGAPLANNMFFGGDLDGVREKLPYIASLGTRLIYLSPIFRAASNHKYDTGDYGEVDAAFGGERALADLIGEAEKYNIRIVLDGVFNHTGADSLYFNRYGNYQTLGAYQSEQSPYAHWYTFRDFPNDYEAWWGIEILPRLNLSMPDCRAYFVGEGGIVSKYASLGIGGMRLDVADELDSDFIAAIKRRLCEHSPDAILYGEVWEDASNKIAYSRRCRYYLGDELDGVMNYPLRTGILRYVREKDPSALRYYFFEVLPNMPKRIADAAMNLLGTHDTLRVLTALGGPSPDGKTNDELVSLRMSESERKRAVKRLFAAYLIAATVPGVPAVYYGDEVGVEGYSDPFNRTPFPWHRMDEELLSHYRAVAKLRKSPVYRDGEMRLYSLENDRLIFSRIKGKQALLTLYYNGESSLSVRLPEGARVLLGKKAADGILTLSSEEAAVVRMHKGDELIL